MGRGQLSLGHSSGPALVPLRAGQDQLFVGVLLVDPNVFETANAGFAQAIYEEFLRDPAAVDPEWRRLFESGVVGERNGVDGKQALGAAGTRAGSPARSDL